MVARREAAKDSLSLWREEPMTARREAALEVAGRTSVAAQASVASEDAYQLALGSGIFCCTGAVACYEGIRPDAACFLFPLNVRAPLLART